MTEDHFDYARTYAAMEDGELLALFRDPSALTDSARAALQEEVNGRGLGSAVDQESVFPVGQQRPTGGSRITKLSRRWIAFLSRQLNPLGSPQFLDAEGEQGLSDIEPGAESHDSPQPVRGWLLILISYMICVPVLETLEIARQNFNRRQSTFEMFPGFQVIVVAWVIAAIPAFLFMFYAGIGLLGKWRHSVKIAKISLGIGMIVAFLFNTAFGLYHAITREGVMRTALSDFDPGSQHGFLTKVILVGLDVMLSTVHAFYYVLPNLIALLYLQKSRRVRLTYPGG